MKFEDVYDFVSNNKLAVISTVTELDVPESAVVEFAEYSDLTIIIDTLTSSRKYKNLRTNKQAAIVIGWDDDITVQINAVATELKGNELDKAKKTYFAKNARAEKWQHRADIAYFSFRPVWVRYSDVSKEPWVIEEFRPKTTTP